MRILSVIILLSLCTSSVDARELRLSEVVKASLVFRDDFDAKRQYYPHELRAFIRLDNTYDSSVEWGSNSVTDVEAELFDSAGKPVPSMAFLTSVQSNSYWYYLPYGSRLDWMISHGGVTMNGNLKDSYALVVGDKGWLIPIRKAGSYKLRIRLRGVPWLMPGELTDKPSKLLLDLAPTKIVVTP